MEQEHEPNQIVNDSLSPQERQLKRFALYFFLLQLILLPVTIFLGDLIVGSIDLVAHSFFGMNKVKAETNHFWQVLAVSLTASLALCSFRIWFNPRKNIDWTLPILVATGSASICFLSYFLYYSALSLLLGFLFQFIMFVPMFFLWWRAKASVPEE